MAKRTSLSNLGDRIMKKGAAPQEPEPAPGPDETIHEMPTPKAGKKEVRKGILVRARPEAWKALKQVALDREITLQDLMIEAINDALVKHGKPPVA